MSTKSPHKIKFNNVNWKTQPKVNCWGSKTTPNNKNEEVNYHKSTDAPSQFNISYKN